MIGSNNSISTKRLQTASGKQTYPVGYQLTNVECYIERLKPEVAVMFDQNNAFEMYKLIADGTLDLIISDLIIDQQGRQYIVRGVQPFDNNTDVQNTTEAYLVRKYDGT